MLMVFHSILTVTGQGRESSPLLYPSLGAKGLRDGFGFSRGNVQDRPLIHRPYPPP